MTVYARHFSTKQTPQTQPIPGSDQIPNDACGFSFQVDDWTRLDRFLILGAESGSYYATEQKMTVENAQAVQRCLQQDFNRAVRRIVEISQSGRAPKNDPAIFALALATAAFKQSVNSINQTEAMQAIPLVCRTGTHFFQFVETVEQFRGHGRALNRALRHWYLDKEPRDLSYAVTKYQQRNGWSHRDVLRLCRPKATGTHQDIFHWIVKGWPNVGPEAHPNAALLPIWALEKAKRATTKQEIVRLIRAHRLVRECIPTQWLSEPEVWEALLEEMPLTALIRNLATLTRIGLLAPLSTATGKVISDLANTERLRKSRIHPVAVLAALLTYRAGRGERSANTWTPVAPIVDALDGAFYNAFGNVETTGKRWLLGIDTSSSMICGQIAGIPGLHPRLGAAALALVTANVEPNHHFVGFTHIIQEMTLSPRQRLDDVVNTIARFPCGGTDCALPMAYATELRIPVDIFVVLTDSQSWAGPVHASQALNLYRQKMGIPAKAVCVGMVANQFTVLDPNDAGSLNVTGFDTAVPQIISDFASH